MIMEKNNEKDLQMYIQPEMNSVSIKVENVVCVSPLEPGEDGGEQED